jgi:2-polyprenyl-3-methyl-5-hydroxy-6-metoxy-1,4-benzoquinol methylase
MDETLEAKLGISGDYQHKALLSKNPFQANWHRNKYKALAKLIKKHYKGKVLDIGAGSGNFEILFHSKFTSITSIDYHEDSVQYLKHYCRTNDILNVNAMHLSISSIDKFLALPENDYDVILLLDVIEHIDEDTALTLFKKLAKLLKESGVLIISTPNYSGTWVVIEYLLDLFKLTPPLNNAQHINKFSVKKLVQFMDLNGFNNLTLNTINNLSFLVPIKKVSEKLVEAEMKSDFKYGNLILASFESPNKIKK